MGSEAGSDLRAHWRWTCLSLRCDRVEVSSRGTETSPVCTLSPPICLPSGLLAFASNLDTGAVLGSCLVTLTQNLTACPGPSSGLTLLKSVLEAHWPSSVLGRDPTAFHLWSCVLRPLLPSCSLQLSSLTPLLKLASPRPHHLFHSFKAQIGRDFVSQRFCRLSP